MTDETQLTEEEEFAEFVKAQEEGAGREPPEEKEDAPATPQAGDPPRDDAPAEAQ